MCTCIHKMIKRLRIYSKMLIIVVICGWWNKVIVILLFGFPVSSKFSVLLVYGFRIINKI